MTIKLKQYISKSELRRQMRNKGYTKREIDCLTSLEAFARWFAHKNQKQMSTDVLWAKEGVFNDNFLCKDHFVATGQTKEITI